MSNPTPSLPGPSQGNIIQQTILQLRLVWRLLRDSRVLWLLKLIPVGGVLYVFFPFDLIVDLAPIIGQLDDAGILLGSLVLFVQMCPPDVVKEHMDDLTSVTVKGSWKETEKEKLPEKIGESTEKAEQK
jgi:uncharacterized membrane protein YkvA (DUF1232 family)